MHRFKTRKYFIRHGLLLATSIPLIISGRQLLLTAVFSLALTYWLVGHYIHTEVLKSHTFRFITSFTLYGIFLQICSLLVWIINRNFPLDAVPYVTLGIIGLVVLHKKMGLRGENNETKQARVVILPDLVALVVSAILVAVIFAGPIRSSKIELGKVDYRSIVVSLMNTSLDDPAHLSRVNDRLRLNRGVLYDSDAAKYVVHQNTVSTYPPGWHSANALLIKMFSPKMQVGGGSLVAYVGTKFVWLIVLVYYFVLFTLRLGEMVKNKTSQHRWTILDSFLAASTVFFSYYMLLEQFKEGFYNFFPVLIYLLLIGMLLLGSSKKASDEYSHFIPLVLLMVGASLSWILIAPAFALLFLVLWVYGVSKSDIISNLGEIIGAVKANIITVSISIASVLTQVWLLYADSSRSFAEGINDPGGITKHSTWYAVFIITGTLLTLLFVTKPKKFFESLLAIITGLLTCALFVYLFQMVTTLKAEYYYYKSLNTALILLVPIAILGWGLLHKKISYQQTKLSSIFIATALLIALPLCIGIEPVNTSNVSYVVGLREFSPKENVAYFNNIVERSTVNRRDHPPYAFTYIPERVGYIFVGSNLLDAIQPRDECYEAVFSALARNKPEIVAERARKSCVNNHITIFTRNPYAQSFGQLPQNVTVRTPDKQ